MEQKRLLRSNDRVIAGVCGGIAQYLEVDPTLIRVAYAVLTLCTVFCGFILYPILWLVMPVKPIGR